MITTNIQYTLESHFPGISYKGSGNNKYKLFINQTTLNVELTLPTAYDYYYKLEVWNYSYKMLNLADTDIDYLLVMFKDSLHRLSTFYNSLYL